MPSKYVEKTMQFSLKASVQYESYNLGDGLQTVLCVSLKGIKSMEIVNTYLKNGF